MQKKDSRIIEHTAFTYAGGLAMAIALMSMLFVSGCREVVEEDVVVVGEWESDDITCGDADWMELDDDLEGEARIHFYMDGNCYYLDFDVELEDISGDTYDLVFEVEDREYAAIFDFEMECEVEDNDELECEGSDGFADFEWVWERD